MADDSQDSPWHLVHRSRAAIDVQSRAQIEQWSASKKYWSGTGQKHIKSTELKSKVHVDGHLGAGGAAFVERVTYGAVAMARKKIDRRGHRNATLERLREEAEIMDKLVHRHIVSLVGTYTQGPNVLYILTYPVAVCDLHRLLDDIEDLHLGTSADEEDAGKRFEKLGFRHGGDDDAFEKQLHAYLVSLLGCVTEALTYIHAQRIRHQDLKPSNILLAPGQVYLADFGISRDLKDSMHSVTDSCAGFTLGYAAPEVEARAMHHPASADVYSLGAVFLNVAAVVYGETRERCREVMCEKTGSRRATIEAYLEELRPRAVKTGRAAEDALTCMPRHLLGLTEAMLAHDPEKRPSSQELGERLVEMGGIEQVYHGRCCKKSSAYVSKLIDNKLLHLAHSSTATTTRLATLESERAADKALIATLTATNETHEARLVKERNHVAELYKKQLANQQLALDIALARNRALEADIAALRGPQRRGGGGKKVRPPMLMQLATTIGTMTVPQPTTVAQPSTTMAMTMATVAAAAPPNIPPPDATRPPPPGPLRRQSGLPVPVRPSTPLPLRVQTPTTPVGRSAGGGSAESTLLSSVHSSFSVTSMASSVSSVEEDGSPVVGRGERGDVVVAQDGVKEKERERERVPVEDVGRERGQKEKTLVMTWAERARGRVKV
ncbi:serine/threonine protein kinase [Pseudogymnoascus sp. WSF 3629]|nr:serine/threonine protein kinase [Pseudogymnoascus sp. WSF 3629]